MRIKITHLTHYQYEAGVSYALQRLRLTPESRSYQSVLSWSTEVDGGAKQAEYRDHHGNHVELISIDPGRLDVSIRCEGQVETSNAQGMYGKHRSYVPMWLFQRATDLTRPGPLVRKLVRSVGDDFENDISRMHDLSSLIREKVKYETGVTHSASTAEHVLEAEHGVCQDHAHVFISAARLMGYAARYVGGYLVIEDQVEQSAGHAWAEIHIDDLGWVGFDISNGISPDDRYVRVATGLDYSGAAPISGMRFGDGGEKMTVSIEVQRQ